MLKKTWKEFADCKLLWWVNRSLHLFGWAIIVEEDETGVATSAYPARVGWRGFTADVEEDGFQKLTSHLADIAADLEKETLE